MRLLRGFKQRLAGKTTAVILFAYGIAAGGVTPLLLSRCGAGCNGCGACGSIFLGILPLFLFLAFKNRLKKAGQRLLFWRRTGVGYD